MGSEKRIGIVLLAAALVACSCASPVADREPSPEQEQNGYVESRRCEVEISVIIVLQVLCMVILKRIHYTGCTSGQQHLHLQLCCGSAILPGRSTTKLYTVCSGQSRLPLR